MKDGDGRCGPYVLPSKNLQAETNMDYRNECVDWFSFGDFGDGYGSFFGVYVDFISCLVLRKFASFHKEGNGVGLRFRVMRVIVLISSGWSWHSN